MDNRRQRRQAAMVPEAVSRPKPWSAKEYAEFRGMSERAATQERYRGDGPPYIQVGGKNGARIYYDPADVWAWLDQHKVMNA